MTQEPIEADERDNEKGVKVMLVLYPRQVAKLDAYAKRVDRSRSSAVRALIDNIPERTEAKA